MFYLILSLHMTLFNKKIDYFKRASGDQNTSKRGGIIPMPPPTSFSHRGIKAQ